MLRHVSDLPWVLILARTEAFGNVVSAVAALRLPFRDFSTLERAVAMPHFGYKSGVTQMVVNASAICFTRNGKKLLYLFKVSIRRFIVNGKRELVKKV